MALRFIFSFVSSALILSSIMIRCFPLPLFRSIRPSITLLRSFLFSFTWPYSLVMWSFQLMSRFPIHAKRRSSSLILSSLIPCSIFLKIALFVCWMHCWQLRSYSLSPLYKPRHLRWVIPKALWWREQRCLVEVCKSIYESRKWPDDFINAINVTINKKINASECADHRTINLI